MPCIAPIQDCDDHLICQRVTLDEILNCIIPEAHLARVGGLQSTCSDRLVRSKMRHNRNKRAIRALIASEQNLEARVANTPPSPDDMREWEWVREEKEFLERLVEDTLLQSYCHNCGSESDIAIMSWCVDCGSWSCLCFHCSHRFPSRAVALLPPCIDITIRGRKIAADHHISVTFRVEWDSRPNRSLYESSQDECETETIGRLHCPECDDAYTIKRDYNLHKTERLFPGSRYGARHALTVLKQWYVREPLGPWSLFFSPRN